jgi:transcriptional regulator with XRE-family HTH domain
MKTTDKKNQTTENSRENITNKPFSIALGYLIANGKGVTQTKVAHAIGISQPYISDLIKGDRSGSEATRRDIADFFGIDYEEFLNIGNRIINGVQNKHPEINSREPKKGAQPSVKDRVLEKINRIEIADQQKLQVIETFLDGLAAGLPAEPYGQNDQKKTGTL